MRVTLAHLEAALGPCASGYSEPTFDCPFCRLRGSKGQGHIHVSIEKNAALCHNCGFKTRNLMTILYYTSGKISRRLLRDSLSSGVRKAVREILEEKEEAPKEKRRKMKLPKEYQPITFPVHGLIDEKCWEYMEGRGLDQETVEACQVGYAADGRFAGMLIFPVRMGGKLVFYTSRQVLPFGNVKTLHPKGAAGIKKAGIVFNFDNADGADCVIVSEGPFDALSWPSGCGVGVGTLGHVLLEKQARMLSSLSASEFVICFDADSQAATIKAAEFLCRFTEAEVSYILLEEGDPNSEREYLEAYFERRQSMSLKNRVIQKFSS